MQELDEAIKLMEIFEKEDYYFELVAKLHYKMFEALIHAGFTREEAIAVAIKYSPTGG